MIRRTLKYYRQLNTVLPGMETVLVERPDQLGAAKLLHARSYVRLGIVTEADLTPDGYIGPDEDPEQDHAQYFIVHGLEDGAPHACAAVRIIYADPDKGLASFPTYVTQQFYTDQRKLLESLDVANIGEISALVREQGVSAMTTLMLYRAIWHHALARGYVRLLVSCDARLHQRCKMIFGKAWMRAGPDGTMRGVQVVPVLVNIPSSLDEALKLSRINPVKRLVKRRALKFFLDGLPPVRTLTDARGK
jgi:hypothetical protein